VFLDIQMPVVGGFEVLERLRSQPLPQFVFVTAHDRYAVQAFEVQALDYLLKPFDRERFDKAMARVRSAAGRTGSSELAGQIGEVLEGAKGRYWGRVAIKESDRVIVVRAADIDWIESAGNYVEIHVATTSYLMRATLTYLQSRLNPAQFGRIHRSTLVNIERIKEIVPLAHGDCTVVLQGGKHLLLGRNHRDAILGALGLEL
jgi:two-component system LytT family response regulator